MDLSDSRQASLYRGSRQVDVLGQAVRLVAAVVAVVLVACGPPGKTCSERCRSEHGDCEACCALLPIESVNPCLNSCECDKSCCLEDCGGGALGQCSVCRSQHPTFQCDPEKTRDTDGDGFSFYEGDCDDSNPDVNPNAPEVPNQIDDDCDGFTDEDWDGDGYTELEGDCDDTDPDINPSVTETCGDGVDNNCNGFTDADEPDRDGDGFGPCAGDCDDDDPQIGPASVEDVNDLVDNDCDGLTDEPREACDCTDPDPNGWGMLQAMDFCNLNGVSNVWTNGENVQFAVVERFGAIVPRTRDAHPEVEGLPDGNCRVLIICNGEAGSTTPQSDPGLENTDPDPLTPGEEAKDLAQLAVTLRAPHNAGGFSFDFMFLSAEYPEWVCTQYEDTFYAIIEDPNVNNGQPFNISFDSNNRAISVNSRFFEWPDDWTQSLVDTGYDAPDPDITCNGNPQAFPGCNMPDPCPPPNTTVGSSTGWLRTTSPVTPGETVTLTFSIHDEDDFVLDSCVVIDNFQWLTTPVDEPVTEK